MKVPPRIHILRRSSMPSSRLMRKTRTHMAQGLKPSSRPMIRVIRPRDRYLISISPTNGRGNFSGMACFSGGIRSAGRPLRPATTSGASVRRASWTALVDGRPGAVLSQPADEIAFAHHREGHAGDIGAEFLAHFSE